MSSKTTPLRLVLSSVVLAFGLLACGDLTVDLSDDEKDDLAVYVENGGETSGSTSVGTTPTITPPTSLSDAKQLEHLAWDAVLRRFNDNGFMQYSKFWGSPDHRELLNTYAEQLASVDPLKLESPQERLAFWLNAYNALVFQGVVDGLAVDPDFRVDTDDFVFFKTARFVVGGEVYSLDQIEHGVIRGDRTHSSVSDLSDSLWSVYEGRHASIFTDVPVDPRIHVGLNCAATSCPPLPSAAFVASKVDAQLTERAEAFVNDASRGAGPNGISMLFTWFAVDFETVHGSAMGFVEAYRSDTSGIDFNTSLNYDWALNGE